MTYKITTLLERRKYTNMFTYLFTYESTNDNILSGDSIVKMLIETVPITKFNRGQAGRIFGDVKKTNNTKVVIKNNEPEVVLLSPQEYNKLASVYEQVKEKALYQKIAERISKDSNVTYSREEVMKELGISEEDLNSIDLNDVEI